MLVVQSGTKPFGFSLGGSGGGPMISKITRSDPALIQYAVQSFGSTNLSEEDWKKAEDHYKVGEIKFVQCMEW
jgi:hypothetical protein